jgi:hypothetical protein
MASTPCKIEDFIAQSEEYYAAYSKNGTFPFITKPLAEDSPLCLAYPKFVESVTKTIDSYGSITLVNDCYLPKMSLSSERHVCGC